MIILQNTYELTKTGLVSLFYAYLCIVKKQQNDEKNGLKEK